jgi:5'(3')-deoxyribonucleotidase
MNEKEKTKLFLDMDGVLADFMGAVILHPDYKWNKKDIDKLEVFDKLNPIPGAIDAVTKLWESGRYDMYIATTAPWDNPDAWTHKREWVEKYFPMFKKRLIMTHHKDMLCGNKKDIIIDDRKKNGVEKWNGVHIHFGEDIDALDWEDVLEKLEI